MNRNLLPSIKNILLHPYAFHAYLWLALIINELLDLQYVDVHISNYLGNRGIAFSLMVTGVYINLIFLAPLFLYQKKYIYYIVSFLILHAALAGIWVQWHILQHTNCILFLAFRNHFSELMVTSLQFLALQYLINYFQSERRKQKLENEQNLLQLNQLKGQLNPHFLFNTMNNFYALAVGKSDKLPNLILQHADLLRYTLYETESLKVPLEKEIEFLVNYVELERIRLEDSVDVKMEVDGVITGQMIAPLLLVPLFDNAFKYCGAYSDSVAFVQVELKIHLHHFQLKIYNSKDPHHSARIGSGGIGLANVRKRLELLYKNQYELDVQETGNIFGIELNIQL